MKYYLLLFFIVLYQFSIAQVEYEKGYVVENNGDTIQCLIKNFDWGTLPTYDIRIKKLTSDESEVKTMREIQTFEIYNKSKYIRKTISVDQSPTEVVEITTEKNPIWKTTTVFLQVLVEGEASLYCVSDYKSEYFYYSLNGDTLIPLVYKKYYTNSKRDNLATNNLFRTQLWNDVKCDGQEMKSLQTLEYNGLSLMKYFEKYNECKGKKYSIYYKPNNKKPINVKAFGGIFISQSFLINRNNESDVLDFPNNKGFHVGIELESIISSRIKRFAILAQPNFEHFTSEYNDNNDLYSIHYNSFNFPVGARFYIINRKDLKMHISGFLTTGLAVNIKSNITLNNNQTSKIVNQDNYSYQLGLEYKKWGIYDTYIQFRSTESTKYFRYGLTANTISLVYKLK